MSKLANKEINAAIEDWIKGGGRPHSLMNSARKRARQPCMRPILAQPIINSSLHISIFSNKDYEYKGD